MIEGTSSWLELILPREPFFQARKVTLFPEILMNTVSKEPTANFYRESALKPCTTGNAGKLHEAGAIDHEKLARGVRLILEAVGENLDREGLEETPDRVARMYSELLSSTNCDPAD